MTVLAGLQQLGRFRLLRELGRGAQATVWLAHDPRLDREVALKLLSPDSDAPTRGAWLDEARAVSRLTHPHIVPVFEADEHAGQPYLVFEFVDGPTLHERRRSRPAWPAAEAVALLLGVLDALAAAHAQGIVHRDLKPSNILLGRDGRPRVMDFGIAARVAPGSTANGRIVGTPGYMSPEAARGEPPLPAMDVFAAGVLLAELLAGAPLLQESDPWRAIARVQQEDLLLPDAATVDDTLRAIVQRAIARRAADRYDSAQALRAALAAWLQPAPGSADASTSSHATLGFLLRRMRHKTDFPALSSSVLRIQRIAGSETEGIGRLAEEILCDVSLTNKLLRMVNTVHFSSVAGGGVATVSRAVALVGFAGIRNMALSVVLLEHMGDKGHAAVLKEEFLRALMAGTLAGELTRSSRESEDAFLAAMFQNLGRLLTEYYFPEEALQIRQRLAAAAIGQAAAGEPAAPPSPAVREAAARQVLGLGLGELGAGVAQAWGLPATLQRALRAPEGEPPPRAVDGRGDAGVQRLRWLAHGANALSDAMLGADGDAQGQALAQVAARYGPALGLHPRDIVECARNARNRVAQMATAMGLHVAAGARARRLLQPTIAGVVTARDGVSAAACGALPARANDAGPAGAALGPALLQQGLVQVRQAVLQQPMRLGEVLQLILQTVQQALDLRCVVLCLREPGSGRLVGRFAQGSLPAETAAAFRIQPDATATSDLFAVLCAKGADLMVNDVRTVASRLPSWYRQRVGGGTFLLLPLMLKGAPIGLLYADKAGTGTLVLGDDELALLRSLRDQAVAAFAKGAGASG